jgi:hypothetical protein
MRRHEPATLPIPRRCSLESLRSLPSRVKALKGALAVTPGCPYIDPSDESRSTREVPAPADRDRK